MEGLTASSLPVASPATAGILSYAFLSCFEGGVEFDWGVGVTDDIMGRTRNRGADDSKFISPSLKFYGRGSKKVPENMKKVKISLAPVTMLPTISISINGVEIKALLDTGSPITVLNPKAAKLAGIETFQQPNDEQVKNNNIFASFANAFQERNAQREAAERGELIMIPGTDGKSVTLYKSNNMIDICGPSSTNDETSIMFGPSQIFVGEIPGLAALNGLGDNSPPSMILGMDVLRSRRFMFLRAQDGEVYFSQ